ncbi:hypothetical protein M885DRAFT_529150 [Pelagophyceae sp. CCMP2097]|nr:hypothetical protein M885DRAFT_529150 [Pelagophyceae sp. CCMP2097]|mmetsp:Transcript_7133/g.23197  ORF Transcript_7133/g.23197 Transcript_7133/m.23197 type:complete len:516 (+) Transcript_7133:88-1635(+)
MLQRHAPWKRFGGVIQTLYGDVSYDDLPRVAWLSATLCSIIASFWLLDSLKDTVLATTVGLEYQPKAKLISVCVTLFIVAGYNSLIDRVSKPMLFYIVCVSYAFIFVCIGGLLAHKTIGMENTEPSPRRLIGWVSYFAIESYGSLVVALFWAFCNASIELEEAKSSYGLIVAFAQLGAIFGSTLATQVELFHISFLYSLGGVMCLGVCAMVHGYVKLFGDTELVAGGHRAVDSAADGDDASSEPPEPAPKATGLHRVFGGFLLVLEFRYVALLLVISTLYEVVLTVLDFEMKVIGRARYAADREGAEQFARLMGMFGQTVNTISFLFSLLCFSYVVRTHGLPTTLMIFPFLLTAATLVAYFSPSLWTLFATAAVLKALTYSLNEPALEMLYMPTSLDIKYKAKAWIDVVGARGAKALGSLINDVVQWSPTLQQTLPQYGNVPALLVSLVLLGVSYLVGQAFETLIASGKIVGNVRPATPRKGSYELVGAGSASESGAAGDAEPPGRDAQKTALSS